MNSGHGSEQPHCAGWLSAGLPLTRGKGERSNPLDLEVTSNSLPACVGHRAGHWTTAGQDCTLRGTRILHKPLVTLCFVAIDTVQGNGLASRLPSTRRGCLCWAFLQPADNPPSPHPPPHSVIPYRCQFFLSLFNPQIFRIFFSNPLGVDFPRLLCLVSCRSPPPRASCNAYPQSDLHRHQRTSAQNPHADVPFRNATSQAQK